MGLHKSTTTLHKKRVYSALGAAAIGLSLISGCGSSGSGGSSEFVIGVPYPQTGSNAQYGANYSDGIRLAVKEANKAGGITVDGKKVKVKAVYCDTQGDTAKAAACGRKLASEDGAKAMLISTSVETFPILSFNATGKNKFLVVSSSASNKLVTEGNPLVVRYWFNTYSYMPSFTKLLKKTLDEQNIGEKVAIMESQDEFGKAWSETFNKGWKDAGGTITNTATYTAGSTDYYPQLTSLMKSNPDIIAIPGSCPQVAPIAKQARELGFAGRFIFQVSCGPDEIVAATGEDAVKGSIFEGSLWDTPTDTLKKFKTDFKDQFNREPVVIVADGYGQAKWLMASAEKAGTVDDPAKLRSALGSVLNGKWNVLGIHDLQKNGETTATIHVRIYNGPGDVKDYETASK